MNQPADISHPNGNQSGEMSGSYHWVHPPLHDCWYLTGPTSSGKTKLALAVAETLGAEIISLDSMAIYRGMDIGTAKPTPSQRERVVHHMLDIVEPTELYSVSQYVMEAHRCAAEIRSRGKKVLVCGGTPLYLKALIRGLFLGPTADWDFRQAVDADVTQYGIDVLRERLLQVDPLLAHKLHPNDQRRMIRALEVARVTGQPLSHWQEQFDVPASKEACPVVVLKLQRSWLHERINSRVNSMLQNGLADEVRGLLTRFGQLGRTAAQAVGYREMIQFLSDQVAWEETVENIMAHTRQFARRQEIWFRSLSELQGVTVNSDSQTEEVVEKIISIFLTCPQITSTEIPPSP
ncbi:MAG: tRNA (adenosine(37)-N6)-dimethylallyltransferase MiaA [Planctomycetales bacterium]|nr:tRNA (adenosine(37)-N6)-dimethylallyltransferase MiaA [Planctomycetales bacterium]